MSAIEDIFDLIEKLVKSKKDKQLIELLLPIKEKLLEAQNENTELQEKIIILQHEMNELHQEINKYKNKQIVQTGLRIDRPHR
jgi:predicted nuclease with TOPRIM domain